MNNLKGRKIKGFKFNHEKINYNPKMDKYIGKVGEITHVCMNNITVHFKGRSWSYPIDQIEKHLIPEENEIPELGEGVLMEVSDSKNFSKSHKRMVIGKYRGLFAIAHTDYINRYKYARPIKEKVVLTHKQIAEKFDIDINQLKIEK